MTSNTISWDDIRDEVLADPEVKAEYEALEPEFQFARRVIALRKVSGLNQRDFAELVIRTYALYKLTIMWVSS